MKHVFSNQYECIHIFANQPDGQEYGCSGTVSFKGNIFYSYGHYAIANIVDQDKRRVLLQSEKYSPTTSCHISSLSCSMSHYERLFAPYITDPIDHTYNIGYFYTMYNEMIEKNKRSLKYEYYTEAIQYIEYAKTYCAWFKIRSKLPAKFKRFINTDIGDLLKLQSIKEEQIAERKARLESPEHQAKLRAKYQVKIDELTEAINTFNAGYNNRIEAWKNHEATSILNYFPYYKYSEIARKYVTVEPLPSIPYSSNDYLRLSKDKTRVETSRGAQVLVKHAVKIWPIVNRSYREQAVYPGNGFKIDYYEVMSIDKGNMRIGCHDIPYSEMLSIANQLNLI